MNKYLASLCILIISSGLSHAQINWNAAGGGDFLTASNWQGGVTPGVNDDAVINLPGTYTVTLNANETIKTLLLNNSTTTFTQSAGTFTISNGFTFTSGIYNLTGGSLVLGNGMNLNGGTFNQQGGNVNLNGTLNVGNTGSYIMKGGVISGGAISNTGSGNFIINSGNNELNNVAFSGAISLQVPFTTLLLSGSTNFTSGSTMTIANSPGAGGLGVLIGINLAGLLDNVAVAINQGDNGGAITGFSINNGTFTLGSTSSIAANTPSGTSVRIGSNIYGGGSGTTHFVNNGTVSNAGGNSTLIINPNGDVTNNGTFSTTNGTMRVQPGGNFSNTGSLTTNGGIINIIPTGNFTNTGTTISSANGGVININPTGTLSLGGVTLTANTNGGVYVGKNLTTAQLGPWNSNGGAGFVGLFNGATLNNTGDTLAISLVRGSFDLNGGIISGGSVTSASPTTAALRAQPNALNELRNVSFVGAISLPTPFSRLLLSGTTNFTGSSTIAIPTTPGAGGLGALIGIDLPGSLDNVAVAINQGDNGGAITGFSINNGTFTLGSTSSIAANTPSGTSVRIGSNIYGGGSGTTHFVNNGTVSNAGGNSTLIINPNGDVTNNGTFSTTNGTMRVQPAGNFSNTGSLATNGGTINIIPTGNFTNTGTTISSANGGVININPTGTLSLGGVTLTANTNGGVYVGKNLTTAQLGPWNSNGGAGFVGLFNGAILDNSADTLAISLARGSFDLNGGIISGGSVTSASAATAALRAQPNAVNELRNVSFVGAISLPTPFSRLLLSGTTNFTGSSTIDIPLTPGFGGLGALVGIDLPGSLDNVAITINHGDNGGAPTGISINNGTFTLGSTSSITANAPGGTSDRIGSNIYGSGTGTTHFVNNGTVLYSGNNSTLIINPNGDVTNNGIFSTTNGTMAVQPGGNFSNTGSLTTNGGIINIIPTGNFTNTGTTISSANGGIININPAGTLSLGGVTLTANTNGAVYVGKDLTTVQLGSWNSNGGAGIVGLFNGATLNNAGDTLSISLARGSFDLNGGIISGGTVTSASAATAALRARSNVVNELRNVAFAGSISLPTPFARLLLSGTTNFTASSTIDIPLNPGFGGLGSLIGTDLTGSLDNVAITITHGDNGGAPTGISINNGTFTLGSTSSIAASAPGGTSDRIGSNIYGSGTGTTHFVNNGTVSFSGNNSTLIINPNGDVTNGSTGTLSASNGTLTISPGGAFINNGLVSASSTGTININPTGGFVIAVGSTVESIGTGTINIQTSNVLTDGHLSITTGAFGIAPTTTAALTVGALGNVTVTGSGILTVGNTSASSITNFGNMSISAGGQGVTGPQSAPGVVNNFGNIQVNGFLYSRITASAGTISGNGFIIGMATDALKTTLNGKIAPGNSPGQITIGGGLDVGGILEMDITSGGGSNNSNSVGSTTPGTGFDTITVRPPPSTPTTATNATIRTSSVTTNLKSANTSQAQFDGDTFWNSVQRWAFVRTTAGNVADAGVIELRDQNGNLQTGFVAANTHVFNSTGTLEFNTTSAHPNWGFFYEVVTAGDNTFAQQLDIVWQPVPVPEPTTVIGISLSCIGIGSWMRKRRNCKKQIEI